MSSKHCQRDHGRNDKGARADLQWPPRSADEMAAWQNHVGTDLEIARHLGLSRASIYGQRMKFGVAALPRKKRMRIREKRPGATLNRFQIARLYGGRVYEDRTSAPPLLREAVAPAYMIAAE